jgi:chromosome segregation ATPase
MKQYLSIAFILVSLVLVISLVVMKREDNALHDSDVATITEYSNRLDTAHLDLAGCNGTILIQSNQLAESYSATVTLSNQLASAQSAIALDAEQLTNLNRQVAAKESDNQALNRQIVALNSQVASLTNQVASTQAGLAQANKNYALLENRLRRDVAARLVLERKFYNPAELQAQLNKLKDYQGSLDVTADRILAGLDIEVNSNGTYYVISPD